MKPRVLLAMIAISLIAAGSYYAQKSFEGGL